MRIIKASLGSRVKGCELARLSFEFLMPPALKFVLKMKRNAKKRRRDLSFHTFLMVCKCFRFFLSSLILKLLLPRVLVEELRARLSRILQRVTFKNEVNSWVEIENLIAESKSLVELSLKWSFSYRTSRFKKKKRFQFNWNLWVRASLPDLPLLVWDSACKKLVKSDGSTNATARTEENYEARKSFHQKWWLLIQQRKNFLSSEKRKKLMTRKVVQ